MKCKQLALAALVLSLGLVSAAGADERDRRGFRERERPEVWRGDIHRFHEHDLARWRGGHWYQGPHGGRDGWWWVVGGVWYFYPAPVYPYPDPFEPPVVAAAPAPAAPQYWYYCANPPGYYPYVPDCPPGWQRVPAGAAPPQPQPAPPSPPR